MLGRDNKPPGGNASQLGEEMAAQPGIPPWLHCPVQEAVRLLVFVQIFSQGLGSSVLQLVLNPHNGT